MRTTLRVPAAAPRLDQYLGVWAIDPGYADMLLAHVESIQLELHLQQAQASGVDPFAESDAGYQVTADGIAVIGVDGPMTKHGSSMFSGGSSLAIRKAVIEASNDEAVRGILLVIDSPGGSVSGVDELGASVLRARDKKPVWAAIDDLGASAAYWVASQADRIFATRSSAVGSIGVYTVVQDTSTADEQRGRKVHVVKYGANKAIGAGGPVTDEQIAEVQRLIDARGEQFIHAVAEGRKTDIQKVRTWADGRVELGPQALALGMIDALGHYDEALAELTEHLRAKRPTTSRLQGNRPMAADTPAPVADVPAPPAAATIAELEAAMPRASAEFVLGQFKSGATLNAALRSYAAKVDEDNAKLAADLDEQKKASAAGGRGNKPLSDDDSAVGPAAGSGDATERWGAAVQVYLDKGKSHAEAARLADLNPANHGLRQAMLRERNGADCSIPTVWNRAS